MWIAANLQLSFPIHLDKKGKKIIILCPWTIQSVSEITHTNSTGQHFSLTVNFIGKVEGSVIWGEAISELSCIGFKLDEKRSYTDPHLCKQIYFI